MKLNNTFAGRGKKVAAGLAAVAVVAGAGTGTAVAAKQITSTQIKNGTIQTQDLTKNNFARFTATGNIISAVTGANAADQGRQTVAILANANPQPLAQVVLDRGTYQISGTAQFYSAVTGAAYGQVTVSGLTGSFGTFYTGDIPDGNVNAGQTSFEGTVTITADNTPVVVSGTISGGTVGTAGAEISATQYKYVKLSNHGK